MLSSSSFAAVLDLSVATAISFRLWGAPFSWMTQRSYSIHWNNKVYASRPTSSMNYIYPLFWNKNSVGIERVFLRRGLIYYKYGAIIACLYSLHISVIGSLLLSFMMNETLCQWRRKKERKQNNYSISLPGHIRGISIDSRVYMYTYSQCDAKE